MSRGFRSQRVPAAQFGAGALALLVVVGILFLELGPIGCNGESEGLQGDRVAAADRGPARTAGEQPVPPPEPVQPVAPAETAPAPEPVAPVSAVG